MDGEKTNFSKVIALGICLNINRKCYFIEEHDMTIGTPILYLNNGQMTYLQSLFNDIHAILP